MSERKKNKFRSQFASDLFTSEILCDRCDNRDKCFYASGGDERFKCELFKIVDLEREG